MGVSVSGSSNRIGGGTGFESPNVISGNLISGVSFLDGATANLEQGNFVGTDAAGKVALGNQFGISIAQGATANTIGGTGPGARNLISGNRDQGVEIVGSGNLVQGNFIGSDVSGSARLGNVFSGIFVSGSNNTIGGTSAGAANLISGNGVGVTLNGSGNLVQGDFVGTDVSGTLALPNSIGIIVSGSNAPASNNTIGGTSPGAGNLLSGNLGGGIAIASGSGNLVQGNLIGTDISGTVPLPNNPGVLLDAGATRNTLGGSTAASRNIISGNAGPGVLLFRSSSANVLQGNYIGTDVTGSAALGNGLQGISIEGASNNTIGGTIPGAGNVISGNQADGIFLTFHSGDHPMGNLVQGNVIGTDFTGTKALNNLNGINISSSAMNTTIGGAATGAGNVIAGNSGSGIRIDTGSATGVIVQGNYVGTDITGSKPLGNSRYGVEIISGATIHIVAGSTPNIISGNGIDGIFVASSAGSEVTIAGNYIGTDVTGTQALPNAGNGVSVFASKTLVGGIGADSRNVISGNLGTGIMLGVGETGNVVLGNYIGTDVTGARALPNLVGMAVIGSNNTVGGNVAEARNLISGNRQDGIDVTGHSTIIEGNYIGTDLTGVLALGNHNGLSISGSNNTIGGVAAGARNIISGNSNQGVELLADASNNRIQGNQLGTDVTGTQALGNGSSGITVSGSNNVIGGTEPGAGNLISGNYANGVSITVGGQENIIQGNLIGTDLAGTTKLGNAVGVYVSGSNNRVGGTVPAAKNIISGNANYGIILAGSENLVQGNYAGTDASGAATLLACLWDQTTRWGERKRAPATLSRATGSTASISSAKTTACRGISLVLTPLAPPRSAMATAFISPVRTT
jgi:titin